MIPARWQAAAAVAACVAPAVWFAPMLLRGEGLYGVDFTILWWFNHDYLGRALGEGRLPLWNPHYLCGMPFLAGYQTNVLYPPAWLAVWLRPTAAVTLLVALHLALAAVGGWFCARRLGASHAAGVLAGWVAGWSCFAVAHALGGHLPVVQTWAWVPWVWGGAATLRTDPRARTVGGVAAATAMLSLAGSAQVAWIGLVGLAVAGAGWAWGRSRAEWGAPVLRLVLALTLGAAWAAPQLLPTAAFAAEGERASAMPAHWYAEFTLRPANLALWVAPDARGALRHPFPRFDDQGQPLFEAAPTSTPTWDHERAGLWWEEAGHVGLVPLFLGLIAIVRRGRRAAALGAVALVGFAAALLVAPAITNLGQPGRWLAAPFTAGGRFRVPARFVALPTLALALLAAEGLRAWLAAPPPEATRLARRAALATGGLLAVCLAPALLAEPPGPPVWWRAVALALAPPAAALALAWAALARGRDPRAVALVLLAGTAAGLAPTIGATLTPFPRVLSDQILRVDHVPARLREEATTARVIRSEVNVPMNNGLTTGLEMVEGFDPLIPAHLIRVCDRLFGGGPQPGRVLIQPDHLLDASRRPAGARWLDLLNARYVWEVTRLRGDARLPTERLVAPGVIERVTARPRAWLVREVRVVGPAAPGAPPEAVMAAVEDSALDPAAVAIVEAAAGASNATRMTAAGRLDMLAPGVPELVRMRTSIDGDGEGYVVHSVPWSEGWRVHVDGGPPRRPDRVHGCLMGAPVPAGTHDLEWRYHAPGLAAGAWLALLATVAAGGAAFVAARRRAA